MIVLIFIYVVSFLICWFFFRKLAQEDGHEPEVKDIFIVVTPVLNSVICVVIGVLALVFWLEDLGSTKITKKFFLIKDKKEDKKE